MAPRHPSQQFAEREFLRRLRQRAGAWPSGPVGVGIGDDCAVLSIPRGEEALLTTDWSLEGVHFRRDLHSPESVGHRALARGLSDIAAMGGKPLAAFLSLAVPVELVGKTGRGASWVERFFDGLLALATEHRVQLAGGDLAASPSPSAFADIVLMGSVPWGKALLRSGAGAGDDIYITGALGGAAAELKAITAGKRAKHIRNDRKLTGSKSEVHPHLFPQPRIAVGRMLLQRGLATAAIDVSDGLSTDLHHLCEESGVAAEVSAGLLPIHSLAHSRADALDLALHGGEDYELLFTAAPDTKVPGRVAGVTVTKIGRVIEAAKNKAGRVVLLTEQGREPLHPGGYEHFQPQPAANRKLSGISEKRR